MRTLDRHKKIHEFLKYQCSICKTVFSKRRDNILRHIRHLHQEISSAEVVKHVNVIKDNSDLLKDCDKKEEEELKVVQEIKIDNESENTESNLLIIDESMQEELEPKEAEPPTETVVNNRVNVIKSIGNPNKNVKLEKPPEEKVQVSKTHEIQLPPKKKATAKYNPIEQYRKILGLATDDPEAENTYPDHWRNRTSMNFLFRR